MDETSRFGYRIKNDVYIDISHRRFIFFSSDKSGNGIHMLALRKTMMRLLVYLLENANVRLITDDEIMQNVWDIYGLSSSNQRLWQVMRDLKKKLSIAGVPDDLITRAERKGYHLKQEMIITLQYDRNQVN